MNETALKNEIADYAQRLHARGWVANHDGNISGRLGPLRYLATPTAVSKAAVRANELVVVDESGAKVSGFGKPFSEIGLHLTVYRNRSDAKAVIHAHPPTATGFAVAGIALDEAFMAEAVVSLGPGIPTVPFAAPGPAACQALLPYVGDFDGVLLGAHGALTWGDSVEQAYLRMELIEHLAKIALTARQLGGVRPLPAAVMPALMESRRKAGLGPNARSPAPAPSVAAAPRKPVVVACAPAPSDAPVEVWDKPRSGTLPGPPADLAALIRQEIVNALAKK